MLMIERQFFFPSQNFNLYEKGYENYVYEKLMFCFCKMASNTEVSHGKVQLYDCMSWGTFGQSSGSCHHSYAKQQEIQSSL